MQPVTDTTIYQKGPVTVTSTRLIVSNQTYAIRNVTSVRPEKIRAPKLGKLFSIFVGFLLVQAAPSLDHPSRYIGWVVIGIAVALLLFSRPMYAVVLTTAGSEVKAITSRSESTVNEIVWALNQAIMLPA